MNIITAQMYLSNQKIKYLMCSAFPLLNPIHYHNGDFVIQTEIYSKLLLETFIDNSEHCGFFNFCLEKKLPFLNQHYPASESHCKYVDDMLISKIQKLLA